MPPNPKKELQNILNRKLETLKTDPDIADILKLNAPSPQVLKTHGHTEQTITASPARAPAAAPQPQPPNPAQHSSPAHPAQPSPAQPKTGYYLVVDSLLCLNEVLFCFLVHCCFFVPTLFLALSWGLPVWKVCRHSHVAQEEWDSSHEIAWGWLWENIEGLLSSMLGRLHRN